MLNRNEMGRYRKRSELFSGSLVDLSTSPSLSKVAPQTGTDYHLPVIRGEEAFARSGQGRESLSRRYITSSPTPSNPSSGRKRWAPKPSPQIPESPSGMSRSPSGNIYGGGFLGKAAAVASASPKGRGGWQSEMDLSGRRATMGPNPSWSRQSPSTPYPRLQPPRSSVSGSPLAHDSPTSAANPLFPGVVMRAKSLKDRLRAHKDRRLTMPNLPAAYIPVSEEPEPLPKVEEYSQSDLYQRTRSPGRRSEVASGRRDSSGSDYSFASSRVQPSASLGAGLNRLREEDNPAVRRMNEIRQKLRKSQENLALGSPEAAEVLGSRSALEGLNRSKSYGSLAGVGLLPSSPGFATPSRGVPMPQANSTPLSRSRELTKSMGNLYGTGGRHRSASGRSLADTIKELKRASQTDLRGVGRDNESIPDSEVIDDSPGPLNGSFYSNSTVPRRFRTPTGTVARKAEVMRGVAGGRIERASISGDSDSASDHPGSAFSNRHNSQGYNRRYTGRKPSNLTLDDGTESLRRGFSDMNTTARAKQLAERNQSIASWANGTGNGVGRQRNYLAAKILAAEELGDRGGPEVEERSDAGSEQNSYKEKMSRHCQDCLSELRTQLDKAIQAYKMVTADDPQLAPEERDQLEKELVRGFSDIQSRLSSVIHLGERSEPEGGRDDAAISPPTRPAQSGGLGTSLDPNITAQALQHYSDVLVNMVVQQLGKNN